LAKIRAGKGEGTPEGIRTDFVVSYVATGVLAFAFLTLGAAVMYGSGAVFSSAGTVFSTQLVEMYASSLGAWTRPVVLAAAVTAMFSTTLAIIDGYPRVIDRAVKILRDPEAGRGPSSTAAAPVSAPYWIAMAAVGAFTILVLHFLVSSLTGMVDFVTTVAFLTGPVLGFLNLRVITSDGVPESFRPGRAMRVFSWLGVGVLSAVAAAYLMSLLG
jgi:Mn2+/Fe2+ NRAMP family transporter